MSTNSDARNQSPPASRAQGAGPHRIVAPDPTLWRHPMNDTSTTSDGHGLRGDKRKEKQLERQAGSASADHPHVDPGDGRQECYLCGKFVHDVIHSCKGVPVTRAAETRVRSLIDAVRREALDEAVEAIRGARNYLTPEGRARAAAVLANLRDGGDDRGCGECYACIGHRSTGVGFLTVGMTQMIVCPTCGNKRCPHGTDHRNGCTGSNDPGQVGSRYGRVKDGA